MVLLLPAFAYSQEVKPVISNDYLTLIRSDSSQIKHFWPDTSTSIRLSHQLFYQDYYKFRVRKITVRRGVMDIHPYGSKSIWFGGQFNTGVEIKRVNQLPALQTQFVQGRSQNGALVWRGAETGEPFSYGPALHTLEYDGSNYAYDKNGKLVAAGTGNGQAASSYPNNIFRTASMFSQSLRLQGQYRVNGDPRLSAGLKMGQSTENTFIRNNKNTSRNLTATLEFRKKWTSLSGMYTLLRDEFSNPNRNGFLNRVYQDALLTPVSFDNAHNASPNAPQAYSTVADNPDYLLANNGNRFVQTHQTVSLMLERKGRRFNYKITQSMEHLNQQRREGYLPGSAFFPAGISMARNKKDRNYLLDGNASFDIPFYNSDFTGSVKVHYSYRDSRSGIDYSIPTTYSYQRSAHDASLSYINEYRGDQLNAGVNLGSKLYASNTTIADNYFLPNAAAYIRWEDIPGLDYWYVKISGTYNRFNNELPVSRSFSQNSLLQYTTQQAYQFFPVMEVSSFDKLNAVRHTEYTGLLEFSYNYKFTLYGELFNRKTMDDIFPVLSNGNLVLQNIAGHRNKGFELGATFSHHQGDFSTYNTLSYVTYNSRITDVKAGYDGTPMAGFANIHTAIIKGTALGSIVGTDYQRDASNQVMIGKDGFPLVNPTPQVIGNPIPAFTMKMANTVNWKKLSLDLLWEWKKGGQMWNGTQAVLDYYGRSAGSAALRQTTGYVFNGVLEDKQPNTIPVSFYDVNVPVEQNRWTRYGHSGVGSAYIQKADVLRLNTVNLSFKQRLKKYSQQLAISVYAHNLILYTPYKGADPNQLLYDQPNAAGLDYFNLPSVKSFGCNISIQF
ncbi:hypothetical protein A4D02_30690 [Niastella koreensis]|uniref:TonB-dependent receptor n=3 Tax=Niastella koreensis TaxID=354356 RepID=G8THR0_NIAKG|nr:hypothetical protein Niako_1113 [Niastella koreensis GR20-10]OQP47692.1 hypothetical protein A4D02_30690 [Niastella koreensis]